MSGRLLTIANFPRQLTDGRLLAHIMDIARMFGIDLSGLDCCKIFMAHQSDMSFVSAMVARGIQFDPFLPR